MQRQQTPSDKQKKRVGRNVNSLGTHFVVLLGAEGWLMRLVVYSTTACPLDNLKQKRGWTFVRLSFSTLVKNDDP